MSKTTFKTRPGAKFEHKAPDDTIPIDDRPETLALVHAPSPIEVEALETLAPVVAEAPIKRGVGRPSEGVKGFATRLTPGTIADIKALADGLRLRSEGKAIERAVNFYKAHLLREVRAKVGDLGNEAELLRNAHKVD